MKSPNNQGITVKSDYARGASINETNTHKGYIDQHDYLSNNQANTKRDIKKFVPLTQLLTNRKFLAYCVIGFLIIGIVIAGVIVSQKPDKINAQAINSQNVNSTPEITPSILSVTAIPTYEKTRVYIHSALQGAVIVSSNDDRVSYKQKCESCGYISTSVFGITSSYGTYKSGFRCPNCGNQQNIEIQSSYKEY